MARISECIMERAEELPEGAVLCSGGLRGCGTRTAVGQALSRLERSGRLLRVYRGIYMRRIKTRSGWRAPRVEAAIKALAERWGERIVPCGESAAHSLGLTTRKPVRKVYLTSGPSRRIQLGTVVELRHVPRWQLQAPHSKAGTLIRALAYLGRDDVENTLDKVMPTLTEKELNEFQTARALMQHWLARPISDRLEFEYFIGKDSQKTYRCKYRPARRLPA